VTVTAGQRAVADGRGVHTGGLPSVAARRGDDGAARTAAELRERLAAVEKEKASLEDQLAAAHEAGAKSPYDLSQDDWATLAEQGGFRYQMPCYRDGGFRPTAEQLDKLGLSAHDADVIQAAYRSSNEQFGTAMKQICTDAAMLANDDIGACIGKMFQTVYADGETSARKIYTRVDEIRAGKRPEPKPAEMSSQERMLLLFSNGMQGFEADLAKTYGADEAHRISYSDDLCFSANSFR
jgi:hypothetical protein